jgi:hypothetical protein
MIDNNDLIRWTNEIIEEDMQSGELKNILKICEDNFDLWTNKLFPVLQAQKKPCYPVVVKLLHRCGCMNANEDMLRSYFAYIRKRRGEKVGRVSQSNPVAVPVVSSPVVMVEAVAPEVKEVHVEAHLSSPATVKLNDQATYPHVYAPTATVAPEDYKDIREVLARLGAEKSAGWVADWCGEDEYFWQDFLKKIASFVKFNRDEFSIKGNQFKFKKEIESEAKKNVYDLLREKVVLQRKI